jgi:hypothetical protein
MTTNIRQLEQRRQLSAARAEAVAHACATCGAGPGFPCEGGRVHSTRFAAAGITAAPRKPAKPSRTSRSPASGRASWQLRPGPHPWQLPSDRPTIAARLRPEFDSGISVQLSADALETIRREVQAANGRETGGVLISAQRGSRRVIHAASGPGPNAVRGDNWMVHDADFDADFVARTASPGQTAEGGHWHLHPNAGLVPSDPDVRRAAGLATSLDALDRWVELIVGPAEGSNDPPMRGWAFRRTPGGLQMRPATIVGA